MMSFDVTLMVSLRQSFVLARVSSESQKPVVKFFQKYRAKFLIYGRLVFIRFYHFFYVKLDTATESVWMSVFPCDNPGSGRSSYVNDFRDCQTQLSLLRYVE